MLLNMVLQESECCCEWLERCLNAIPFPEMQWKYFFTSFSHFLVKWHPPIFFTFFFIFMEHKYFFPFQQESIFLHFFQLVSSPRTPNVSADRSTKICSVHFLTDHPVWRISLATTILREIKDPWPILQQVSCQSHDNLCYHQWWFWSPFTPGKEEKQEICSYSIALQHWLHNSFK